MQSIKICNQDYGSIERKYITVVIVVYPSTLFIGVPVSYLTAVTYILHFLSDIYFLVSKILSMMCSGNERWERAHTDFGLCAQSNSEKK